MGEIRYRWGNRPRKEFPAPPVGTHFALLVEGRGVWEGDVAHEIIVWSCWCAKQVVCLWDECPTLVRHYLNTADPKLAGQAGELAGQLASWELEGAARAVARSAEHAAKAVNPNTKTDGHWARDHPKHAAEEACNAVFYSNWAPHREMEEAEEQRRLHSAAVEESQFEGARQHGCLRTLLLRRALPERLWPLIDADARVLADALLETADAH